MHEAGRKTVHDPYKYLIIWDMILADRQKLETLQPETATSSVEPLPD